MAIALLIAHVLGIVSSLDSLMRTRTSQGAIAWIVALNTLPLLAVPAYWVFGRTKFHGYRLIRQRLDSDAAQQLIAIRNKFAPFVTDTSNQRAATAGTNLAKLSFLDGNATELLIDGAKMFPSVLAGIDAAEHYILFQFYIVHDDEIGRTIKDHLIAKAKQGVRVYFL